MAEIGTRIGREIRDPRFCRRHPRDIGIVRGLSRRVGGNLRCDPRNDLIPLIRLTCLRSRRHRIHDRSPRALQLLPQQGQGLPRIAADKRTHPCCRQILLPGLLRLQPDLRVERHRRQEIQTVPAPRLERRLVVRIAARDARQPRSARLFPLVVLVGSAQLKLCLRRATRADRALGLGMPDKGRALARRHLFKHVVDYQIVLARLDHFTADGVDLAIKRLVQAAPVGWTVRQSLAFGLRHALGKQASLDSGGEPFLLFLHLAVALADGAQCISEARDRGSQGRTRRI